MKIIPVIDLLGGIVVRASGSDRHNYPPLTSMITQSVDPLQVVTDLLKIAPFSTIYIADLDAIFYQKPTWSLYQSLVAEFPDITFWLDAGIATVEQCNQVRDYGFIPVIGSETLTDLAMLNNCGDSTVLSLDFQSGEFLGVPELLQQPQLWKSQVIAMNLDKVGRNSGVDGALLNQLVAKQIKGELVAAGGVRNQSDIEFLEQIGIDSVLVASALHDKKLSW